jgi:hypothetical protein
MSLVKRLTMTEKKIAANRRNQSLPHGPVTAEGKARVGAAHLRHGFYAKAQETQKDVKNGDRSDYVYENTGEATKCLPQECPFYTKVRQMSVHGRKSVGLIGRTRRRCTKKRGEVSQSSEPAPSGVKGRRMAARESHS